MARTRTEIIDDFRQRYPSCDSTTAGKLLESIHEQICRRIPVATIWGRASLTNNASHYFFDVTTNTQWAVTPTGFTDQAAINAAAELSSLVRVLQIVTDGYQSVSSNKRLIIDAYDRMDESDEFVQNVPVNAAFTATQTTTNTSPDRAYVSHAWRSGSVAQYSYGFQIGLAPIPVFATITPAIWVKFQVVPKINSAGYYIPAALSTEQVYVDGMCYLWAKRADRANIPSWFTMFENAMKQEQWHWLNTSRFQHNVTPSGFNHRDVVT